MLLIGIDFVENFLHRISILQYNKPNKRYVCAIINGGNDDIKKTIT